jgi:hypothetical protein
VAISVHGEVQRRLALLEARQAAIQRVRIVVHDRADKIQVSDGHRRKDMMARSAVDQERHERLPGPVHLHRVVVRRMVERRPADDVELVHVAHARRTGLCCLFCRCSISAFSARQLEKP